MRTERGVSLIELMFAVTILAICAMALGSAYIGVTDRSTLTEEELLATNAIRAKISEIQGEVDASGVSGIVTTYSQSANAVFDVEGLTPPSGTANVGTVTLHMDETDVPAAVGGSTMDLNGDDDMVDTAVAADDALLVPIQVVVTWQSRDGPVSMRRYALLAKTDPQAE